mgnify:FL=1|nr:hypothetical protein [uncultured Capnocytophaga sp.]
MTEEKKELLEKELTEKFGSKVTITIEKSERDYSKDPFFVKKLEEANEFLKNVKFPDILFKKKTTAVAG